LPRADGALVPGWFYTPIQMKATRNRYCQPFTKYECG